MVHAGHRQTHSSALRTPPLLRNHHICHTCRTQHTLDTDHMRIGTEHDKTHAAIEHMRIKQCNGSTLTSLRSNATEHPAWVAALSIGDPCHSYMSRHTNAQSRDMHGRTSLPCISLIKASVCARTRAQQEPPSRLLPRKCAQNPHVAFYL
jgi:hypothetical protein